MSKEKEIKNEPTEVKIVYTDEQLLLETRKTKALEKIANSLDALTVWFEEVDKQEWSDRIQYYLAEWHKTISDTKSR